MLIGGRGLYLFSHNERGKRAICGVACRARRSAWDLNVENDSREDVGGSSMEAEGGRLRLGWSLVTSGARPIR